MYIWETGFLSRANIKCKRPETGNVPGMLKKQQEGYCGQNGVSEKKKKWGQRGKKEGIQARKAFDRTWPFTLSKMAYHWRVLTRRKQNLTYLLKGSFLQQYWEQTKGEGGKNNNNKKGYYDHSEELMQTLISKGDEKQSESGYILTIELSRFPVGSDVVCVRRSQRWF